MNHNEFRQFTNKVFGGWDFGIEDERNAELIHISLFRELRVRAVPCTCQRDVTTNE